MSLTDGQEEFINEKEEILEILDETRDTLMDAYNDLLRASQKDKENGRYYKAYVVDKLRILIDSGHDFLTNDPSIEHWQNKLTNQINDITGH
jgi:hypothetical protein